MNLVKSERTPCEFDWCTHRHEPADFEEGEDPVLHTKGFGLLDNGTDVVLEFWITALRGKVEEKGILLNVVEMDFSTDLADLSRDCLEAAKWIEETKLLFT